jgi:methylated-DNA-[protein]-cysteine S-methyltransferase
MDYSCTYSSPLGVLLITAADTGITGITFQNSARVLQKSQDSDCIRQCINELEDYFAGTLQCFTVALQPKGNTFQKTVWQELCKIPYGKTVSYMDIARSIGKPEAVRAVGSANNRNRIPIIIPCHRVIGRDGSLTGYAGGIWRKEYLLKLEKALLI